MCYDLHKRIIIIALITMGNVNENRKLIQLNYILFLFCKSLRKYDHKTIKIIIYFYNFKNYGQLQFILSTIFRNKISIHQHHE